MKELTTNIKEKLERAHIIHDPVYCVICGEKCLKNTVLNMQQGGVTRVYYACYPCGKEYDVL